MNNLTRGHIPALDGLRGLAIALVMARHFTMGMEPRTAVDAGFLFFSTMGWVGVDLFFVLSGFLITGILLDARGRPGYLRNFYARRVLRIFPLYYAVLIVLFVVLPLLHSDPEVVGPLREAQFWYWGHLANWWNALGGAMPLNTGHFWSLAVEEQFYLVWPLVVLFAPGRKIYAVCGLAIAGSLLLRIVMIRSGGLDAAYVVTPARLDGLALGGMLAAFAREPAGWQWLRQRARTVTLIGFGGLLLAAAARGGLEWEPWVAGVGTLWIALMFGGLLAWTVTAGAGTPIVRVLSGGSLRTLGKYSYALYIFHYPLVYAASYTPLHDLGRSMMWGSALPGRLAYALALAGISLAAAWVSWHVLELPFLRLKRHFETSSTRGPGRAAPEASVAAGKPLTAEA